MHDKKDISIEDIKTNAKGSEGIVSDSDDTVNKGGGKASKTTMVVCDNCQGYYFEQVQCFTLEKVEVDGKSDASPHEVAVFVRCANCMKAIIPPKTIGKVKKESQIITPEQMRKGQSFLKPH